MENFGRNYENIQNNEQKEKLNESLASLNDTQKQIETEARNYALKEIKNGNNIIPELDGFFMMRKYSFNI